jgi:2-polyprenyl-6-methoxyphenol hydroxylase-like FAD-dependent oxidoreductase
VFDMVIGADGLHSNVRGLVFGEESRFIKHLGSYISFFSTDHHMDLDRWELMHTMPGKSVCLYRAGNDPIAKAWFIFSSEELDYDRRDLDRQRRILAEKFAGEGWEIPRLIESMNSSPDFYFDSMAQIHMDSWSKGRTALVGDAGYCASPASGQGTALALVGAYVLAGEIMAAEGDHTVAFPGYERKMREFVRKNQVFGQKAVKQFARGRLMVWLQAKMIRMLPHLPWKNLVIGGILDEIKAAASGITLESYDGR